MDERSTEGRRKSGPITAIFITQAARVKAMGPAGGNGLGSTFAMWAFCWPVPCPALWRELMHCSKCLVASPNARDFAERVLRNIGSDPRQSPLMPAARITLPHFSVSSAMSFPIGAAKGIRPVSTLLYAMARRASARNGLAATGRAAPPRHLSRDLGGAPPSPSPF